MKQILRRLDHLEGRLSPEDQPRERLRVIVDDYTSGPPSPETSECHRSLTPGGIIELVRFRGSAASLTEEEIDGFVERFPIHTQDGRVYQGPPLRIRKD